VTRINIVLGKTFSPARYQYRSRNNVLFCYVPPTVFLSDSNQNIEIPFGRCQLKILLFCEKVPSCYVPTIHFFLSESDKIFDDRCWYIFLRKVLSCNVPLSLYVFWLTAIKIFESPFYHWAVDGCSYCRSAKKDSLLPHTRTISVLGKKSSPLLRTPHSYFCLAAIKIFESSLPRLVDDRCCSYTIILQKKILSCDVQLSFCRKKFSPAT
jgi:hypothetical protein